MKIHAEYLKMLFIIDAGRQTFVLNQMIPNARKTMNYSKVILKETNMCRSVYENLALTQNKCFNFRSTDSNSFNGNNVYFIL